MKILKIEFENLNSLKGKWEIDFTHPDYKKNHDIFVISGPTGAGKTTILDAISLALYGKTPRIQKISNGSYGNDVMTRGTGSCRSKVTFQCKKGIFTSEFMQRRAGGKASGKLQATEYSVTDENGIVLNPEKGSSLEAEIEKITQLSYSQFSRSIMLAQGDFSAFLKSDNRARAEILEKLTGTERFKEIGVKVNEIFSEKKKKYDNLKEKREELEKSIFSDEEKAEREKESLLIGKKIKEIDKNCTKLELEKKDCQEIQKLADTVNEREEAVKVIHLQIENFKSQREKLEKARRAVNCESDYNQFNDLRENQKKLTNELKEKEIFLEKLVKISVDLEAKKKELEEKISDFEAKSEENQKIREKVKEIDIILKNSGENLEKVQKRNENDKEQLELEKEKYKVLSSNISQNEESLKNVEKYLSDNQNDSEILQIISVLQVLYSQKEENAEKFVENDREIKCLTSEIKDSETKIEEIAKNLEEVEKQIKDSISENSLIISEFLAKNLEKGKPCPVCGSIFEGTKETCLCNENNSSEIIENTVNLNSIREKIKSSLAQEKSNFQTLETELKNLKNKEKELNQEKNKILQSIKDSAKSLNKKDEELLSLDIQALEVSGKKFKENEELQKKLKQDIENSKRQISEISGNITKFQEIFDLSLKEADKLREEFENLKSQRFSLFGEKNVEEEEKKEKAAIGLLKNEQKDEESRWLDNKKVLSLSEGETNKIKANLEEMEVSIKNSSAKFQKSISENAFSSEEEFLQSRMDKSEIDNLQNMEKSLNNQNLEAETSLKDAKENLKEKVKNKKSKQTFEELTEEIGKLQGERELLQKDLDEKNSRLLQDSENRKKLADDKIEFENFLEEYNKWKQVKDWVGKSDGSDLSVFVQNIMFSKLLNLTNKHLFEITGRYKLVPKENSPLDFEINDIHLENRCISNLSGGEQFIVSLSLALGISEFASKNVRVDSLFLDEGFGTLSGELLTQAINALKGLQKNGKMLGIITHVQDVINEIDQRIEVKPISGGYSTIIGSGINHWEN